jgi:hypothetical protein
VKSSRTPTARVAAPEERSDEPGAPRIAPFLALAGVVTAVWLFMLVMLVRWLIAAIA